MRALKGYDILALARYNGKALAKVIEGPCAIGVLLGTFGDPFKNLRILLKTGKVRGVRVHLINTVCKRNKNCELGEPAPDDWRVFAARAKKVETLKMEFPNVRFYISPWLENDEKDWPIVNKAKSLLRKNAPHCKVVWNSHTGVVPDGVLVEKHGNSGVKSDIRSNDGAELWDAPDSYKNTGRLITFGWISPFNLRKKGAHFIPPSKRPDSNRATDEEIRRVWAKLN